MKLEQEIKDEIQSIKEVEKKRGNIKEKHITPRNWGKIKALEWVLENSFEGSKGIITEEILEV